MTAQASRRLFFALWPGEAIQRRLADLARKLADETQGKAVAWHNIHSTLAFLGDVPDDVIPELIKLAHGQRDFSAELVLDRIGWFRQGIVYAAPTESPKELLQLASNLRETLQGSGYRIERRLFVPHITLVRNAQQSPRSNGISPVPWPVRGVRLAHSELGSSGVAYRLVY